MFYEFLAGRYGASFICLFFRAFGSWLARLFLVHSFIYSFIRRLHLFVYSFIYWLVCSGVCLLVYSFARLIGNKFLYFVSARSFVRSFVCSFLHLLFKYPPTYSVEWVYDGFELVHSFCVCSLAFSFVRSFFRSFVRSFVRSFARSFVPFSN